MIKYYNTHTHKKNQPVEILNYFLDEKLIREKIEQFSSIGFHPWHFDENDPENVSKNLREIVKYKSIAAIGETGLDKSINVDLDIQKKIFVIHLEVAEEFNLPVIIHCVKAFNEIIQIKKNRKKKTPWIIHGFNNNLQIAKELIKHNCFLSFGAALLKNNSNAKLVINNIPADKVLLETDDANYTIEEIYRAASEASNISLYELCRMIEKNFNSCFKKGFK